MMRITECKVITISVITIPVITRSNSPSNNLQHQDLKYTLTVIHVIFEYIYPHKWIIHPFTILTYTSYTHNYTFGYQNFGQIELELKYKHLANAQSLCTVNPQCTFLHRTIYVISITDVIHLISEITDVIERRTLSSNVIQLTSYN